MPPVRGEMSRKDRRDGEHNLRVLLIKTEDLVQFVFNTQQKPYREGNSITR